MLIHNKLLLLVAVTAALIVFLDEVIESSFVNRSPFSNSRLGKSLTALSNSRPADQTTNSTPASPPSNFLEHRIAIPIDHNDPSQGFYLNRYWTNTEFYSRGGPVFVHDVGESDAESSAKKYLQEESSYLRSFLQEFRGIGIVWEHRYYGTSLPYSITQTTPIEHFRFLNLNQSLADLPYFAWNFSDISVSDHDLTPASTPWIMIGCSYSGLRAAFSRKQYPETFYAAYAASAPVQLRVNLDTFFDAIWDKLGDRGYQGCAQHLHEAMQYLDQQLSDPRYVKSVKQKVLGPGAEANINGDFALAVANIYSYFQSFGITGGAHSLASLCTYLQHDADPTLTTDGSRTSFERLASWSELAAIINSHFNTTCSGWNSTFGSVCDLSQADSSVSAISWTWQLCTELGLFATQNPGPSSLVSKYMSLEYRQSLCARQFPLANSTAILANIPTAEIINRQSGGLLMRPSNVFWTAGEYDPWRSLTPLSKSVMTRIDPPPVVATIQVPMCNISTHTDTVFGFIIEDAQHCLDYTTDSQPAKTARNHFAKALRQWLPCFEGSVRP